MDFETLKELYSKPPPFCNWQGDMLHYGQIKTHLKQLEATCRQCCERDVSADIIDNITYLGNCNTRTVFWGLELLSQLKNSNQTQRYKDVKKTVWIIFRWFNEDDNFTWE
jgi:hypothetical protein